MNRRLWFGVALICAFGSIYAGMFGLRIVQLPLIVFAVVALVLAFRSEAPPPVDDPRKKG
jgi:hypothetical protein